MSFALEQLPPTPTPSDYFRLQFDPSNVPAKRIVGLLACQRDPLLRKLRTPVLSISPASLAAPPPQRGKGNSKKKSSAAPTPNGATSDGAATPSGKLFELITNDTPIFPEGGGQPTDTGIARLLDANGGERASFVVEGCIRKGLEHVHLVRIPEGQEHLLEDAGDGDVELEVDWDRREDHMAIHTGQHLLSAILDTYNLPTLSWSVTAYPSLDAPYVELPRGLTWAEAQEVEDKCNALIKEGKKVWIDVDVQKEGEHEKFTMTGERETRGIPKDYTGGVIRTVVIDKTDRNACCGTQVPSLSHVGGIHVLPPSIPYGSSKTSSSATKLYFHSGPRALRALRGASKDLSLAAQAIGVARADLPERVAKLDELRKETATREKDLRGELAKSLAESLIGVAEKDGVVHVHRDSKSTHDFEFLSALSISLITALTEKDEAKGKSLLVILTSAPTGSTTNLLIVQSQASDLAKKVNEELKMALEGEQKGRVKGGGAKGKFMSKVDGKWGKTERTAVEEYVGQYRAAQETPA